MPPKKKPKANGFAIFMQSKKRELEAQGQRFPLGLGDPKLQAKCSSLWQVGSSISETEEALSTKQHLVSNGCLWLISSLSLSTHFVNSSST